MSYPARQHPKNNGGNWIRRKKRYAIYYRDGFCCGYCNKDVAKVEPQERALDHLNPVGGNNAYNLITACRECNSSRGNIPWRKFASADAVRRILRNRRRLLRKYLLLAATSIYLGG